MLVDLLGRGQQWIGCCFLDLHLLVLDIVVLHHDLLALAVLLADHRRHLCLLPSATGAGATDCWFRSYGCAKG